MACLQQLLVQYRGQAGARMNMGAQEQELLSYTHKQVSTGFEAVLAPLVPSSP